MSKRKKAISKNYLELIPRPSNKYSSMIDEQGAVTILQENKGLFHWLAQKMFQKPRISQIHLDDMGNFIWPLMDGEHSVNEIAVLVREKFGEKAEPLYPRLVQYFRNLERYGFVESDRK